MPPVKAGDIVRLYVAELQKSKYFLIAGIEQGADGPLLFYISSRLYDYVQTRPHLWPFQVSITKAQHTFMPNNESWMNCTEVCADHNWASVEYGLRSQASKVCGMIHPETKTKIIAAVQNTQNEGISPKHRNVILASLV